jgi:predicted esterase
MITRKLIVPKTARYVLSHAPSAETKEVLFVCHGYAQLATEFIESFADVATPQRIVVAPEGLHRFYQRGGYEKVVASWMTKEDREDDIRDYVLWLDSVAQEVLSECLPDTKITVLGFSQGAATVSRWASLGKIKIDHLILWCGFFPPDLKAENPPKSKLVTVVTASDDKFISPEAEQKQLLEMKSQFATYKHIRFTGQHEIHRGTLSELLQHNQ